MGIFNSIKKSRKKSKDIDEKIEYLNKECQKTGLQEVMTTTGMYFATGQEPNASHNAFKALSHDGQSLGFSGADYNIFTEPIGGLKYSPPHPVTGQRQVAQSYFGIASDFRPVSANSDREILWVFDQSLAGGAGRYFSMELTRGLSPNYFGVWVDTAFGTSILVPYEGNLSPLSDRIKNNLNNLNINNFNDPNVFGPENNTIAFKNDLGDPDFLPINIPELSDQGFNYLKNKAYSDIAGVYDLMKRGQVPFLTPDQVNKILVDPKYQKLLQNDPDLIKQLQRMRAMADDGVEIASADPSVAFPSAPPVPPDPSDAPSVSVDSTEDAKPNVKDAKLGTWMSRQDFIQTYPNSTMVDYLDSLPYGPSDFMTPNPNFPNAWDQNFKGYENYFMNGDLSALGNSEGIPEPRNANSTVVPPRTVAPASAAKPTGFLDSILSAGADAVGRGAAKDVFDYYMDKVEKGHNGGEHNINNLLGRSKNAIERWYARNKTNIVTAREGGKSIFHDAAEQDFMHLSQKDGNLKNITGNLDLARGDGIFDKGDTLEIIKHYDFNGERDLAGGGVIGNLGSKGYAKSKGIMKYLGDDGTKTSPLMKLVITIDQKTGAVKTSVKESLDESVRLGHFEPQQLNVNIEDLRKGIMPEFPKDPPPEMVNGYSSKSRLAPKKLERSSFIKITKKDLAKNHRFKDSEIKDFMNQINAVNDFIKKHPEELIYAQTRYPKSDPRLAQLNWQMDQKLNASKEYMDKHYPENQKLFTKIQKSIKKNIKLTDPKSFKGVKIPKFKGVDLTDFKRRKEVVARHYKKVVKTKKLFSRKKT